MPEQSYPPFQSDTGAVIQPRQLNRWIDVSPQGGALKRTMSYLTVPLFSVSNTWLGYSQIIGAFNIEAPNNFNLKSFEAPTDPNYMLCISWINADYTVSRYALWKNVGEVIYFDCPLYDGEVVKKNFRFEIWNTNDTPIEQTTALNFFTSVRGAFDYMWSNDYVLEDSGTIITSFGDNEITEPILPNDLTGNLMLDHFIITVGVTTVAGPNLKWQSQNSVNYVQGLSATTTQENIIHNGHAYTLIKSFESTMSGTNTTTTQFLFIAFFAGGGVANQLIYFTNGYTVTLNDNEVIINGTTLALNGTNKAYLLALFNGTDAYTVDLTTLGSAHASISVSIAAATDLYMNTVVTDHYTGIMEVVGYYNLADVTTVYDYFFWKYVGNFALPLVFPSNATSTINT